MDDVALFAEIIEAHGGRLGPFTATLRALLKDRGVTETAIAYMERYALKKWAQVGPVAFYPHRGILDCIKDEGIPIALRDGLLIFGSCPNGDPVVVDVREQLGTCGFVACGSMWHVASVREVFLPLSPTPGELAKMLAKCDAPADYYEAKTQREGRG